MRALCDGVLVGKNTLLFDAPQLTVRHVPGKNPVRIVLGGTSDNIESLLKASDVPIVWISNTPHHNKNISSVLFPAEMSPIPPLEILKKLGFTKVLKNIFSYPAHVPK